MIYRERGEASDDGRIDSIQSAVGLEQPATACEGKGRARDASWTMEVRGTHR